MCVETNFGDYLKRGEREKKENKGKWKRTDFKDTVGCLTRVTWLLNWSDGAQDRNRERERERERKRSHYQY